MIVYDRIPEKLSEKTALCIGKFDGFHRGHKRLLTEAEKTGNKTAVLTFVFNRTDTIDSAEEKRELASEYGVDIYIEISAGQDFFSLTPEAFITEIVSGRLSAKHVIVGEDFRFGAARSGDVETLRAFEKRFQYTLHSIPKLREGGQDISSSRIRACIAAGQMEEAADLLGRRYLMRGTVENGNHIGRSIGVPTANIRPTEGKICPPFGVYAVETLADGKKYRGIADFGVKPTIGQNAQPGLEIHMFDCDMDLYGKELTVWFGPFIREEKEFSSVEELHRQIEADIQMVRKKVP